MVPRVIEGGSCKTGFYAGLIAGSLAVAFCVPVIGRYLSDGTDAGDTPITCDMERRSTEYANALRRLSDLKEICGHLEDPERFQACTHSPHLPLNYHGGCEDIGYAAKNLRRWVGARASDLSLACDEERPCARWAKRAKGWDGNPILD